MRRQLKPDLTRPPDFTEFWEDTMAELSAIPAAIQQQPHHEEERPQRTLHHLSFQSLGGLWISGYLIQWHGDTTRPLVIHSHGYGSQCSIRWDWSEAGINVLGVDVRGYGRSYEALPLQSKWGYILTGIETPETSVIRGAVCDYMRAAEVGKSLLGQTTSRFLLHGASFSGGLAVMAESCMQQADLLVAAVPTFGWAEGRNFFVKSGSGSEIARFLDERPESAEDTMLVLRYFDPVNFADRIKCPTLIGLGLQDDVVPANTVYAIANHLAGRKEIMEFPVSHSLHRDERLWRHFDERWIELAHHGIKDDFGESVTTIPPTESS